MLAAIVAATFAQGAAAAISVGPSVNGVATFTDSNTGRNWARLDTFFGQTHNAMVASLTGRGFTVAVRSDLEALFAGVDVVTDFNGVAAITGGAPNRDIIWGSYAPVTANGTIDWAYAFGGTNWTFGNEGVGPDQVPNDGTIFADMNLWAFSGGGAVPEAATWAMLIAGFGMVGFAARRRRETAAA